MTESWKSMKGAKLSITFLGVGYVGGPTMAVIADRAPDIRVIGMDLSQTQVDRWNSDNLPIYEPGLSEVVFRRRGQNLFFTTDAKGSIAAADIIFVCVGTPTKASGVGKGYAAELRNIEAAARSIAKYSTSPKIVVEKSTVPVKTSSAIERILLANTNEGASFEVLSNPEFLAEGTAMVDLFNPDRILIGGRQTPEGRAAIQRLVDVYHHWVPVERIITTNQWSSELSKLTANAFLAQRISSINAISALCEASGADVQEVARAIGRDSRIGPKFLQASVGFGGSCFQKDILNLVYLCESFHIPEAAEYWRKVVELNDWQKHRFARHVVSCMFDTVAGKKIAVLGFAFKKDTGDTRETPAMFVCRDLINDNANLTIFDPEVDAQQILSELAALLGGDEDLVRRHVTVVDDPYTAAYTAHAVVVLTEWDMFKTLDYQRMYDSMLKPAFLFDGRIILDSVKLRQIGFEIFQIGKSIKT